MALQVIARAAVSRDEDHKILLVNKRFSNAVSIETKWIVK